MLFSSLHLRPEQFRQGSAHHSFVLREHQQQQQRPLAQQEATSTVQVPIKEEISPVQRFEQAPQPYTQF